MRRIIITIDENALKDPITIDEVMNTIEDHIQDATDYGNWSELLWNGDYGEKYTDDKLVNDIANSVSKAVNVERD